MGVTKLAAAAGLGAALLIGQGNAAGAAEVTVLASNGVTAVMKELGPQFERGTENKLAIRFDLANVLKEQIQGGEAFDVAILTAPVADDLVKQGKIVAGARSDFARSGVGVAIRAGAPRPDISTVEAFKKTMLDAKSVAYTTQGASGIYFAKLLERLGIAEAIKAKAKLQPGGAVAELAAKGEAELAVQQVSELLPVAGAELLGPFPPEIQSYTVFAAVLGTSAKEPEAAKALIKFLAAPAAIPVIKSKGMEPG